MPFIVTAERLCKKFEVHRNKNEHNEYLRDFRSLRTDSTWGKIARNKFGMVEMDKEGG